MSRPDIFVSRLEHYCSTLLHLASLETDGRMFGPIHKAISQAIDLKHCEYVQTLKKLCEEEKATGIPAGFTHAQSAVKQLAVVRKKSHKKLAQMMKEPAAWLKDKQ